MIVFWLVLTILLLFCHSKIKVASFFSVNIISFFGRTFLPSTA